MLSVLPAVLCPSVQMEAYSSLRLFVADPGDAGSLSAGFRATNKAHPLLPAWTIIRCLNWTLCLHPARIVVLAYAAHRQWLPDCSPALRWEDGISYDGDETLGHTPRPSAEDGGLGSPLR